MKAKKLPPSSSPTAFAAATVRSRKIRSGISGDSTRVSTTRKASRDAAETASSVTVRAAPQPTSGAFEPAFRDDAGGEQQGGDPDRQVEEEDVLPADVAGEEPARDQSDCGTGGA